MGTKEMRFTRKLIAFALALAVAVMPMAAGAAETKHKVSELTVSLDQYYVYADGSKITPKLTVTGYVGSTKKTFGKDDYTVSYYRIVSEEYDKVDEIKEMGEYAIRVKLKGNYSGKAEVLFSVIGKPQTLKVSGTMFTLKVGETAEISPSASGDGTGFSYSTSRKGIVRVKDNIINAKKPGWTRITVKTTGDVKYQRAKVTIDVTVVPNQVNITSVETGEKSSTLSWDKQDVTGYDVRYCTEEAFKKPAKTDENYKSRMDAYKYKKYKTKSTEKKIGFTSGYVKVRAYVKTTDTRANVKYIYGAWSDIATLG